MSEVLVESFDEGYSSSTSSSRESDTTYVSSCVVDEGTIGISEDESTEITGSVLTTIGEDTFHAKS